MARKSHINPCNQCDLMRYIYINNRGINWLILRASNRFSSIYIERDRLTDGAEWMDGWIHGCMRRLTVIVIGNGFYNPSSNPGLTCLCLICDKVLGKIMYLSILLAFSYGYIDQNGGVAGLREATLWIQTCGVLFGKFVAYWYTILLYQFIPKEWLVLDKPSLL